MARPGLDRGWGYVRICDICGERQHISRMHKQGPLTICDKHPGERTAIELSRGNAAQKPFRFLPAPNPKPLDVISPATFEGPDGVILNFVSRMVSSNAQYLNVTSGDGSVVSTSPLPALAWAARYCYDMIQQARRPLRMLTLATTVLERAADSLMVRQQGFGLSSSSTRTNDAFYGGFLASGASFWLASDAAAGGLALLYAYRVLGDLGYINGARAAASFLRNLQAIGSNGTNFTSSDAAGTSRLYTGAITSEVSTVAGFWADHRFYPSCLLAAEFWKALQDTDGDQSLGSTATPAGFTTAPAQLLSTSLAQLRAVWSTGIRDAAGDTYSGLSSTTPREYFNAYPMNKPNTPVTGTGMWEYQDGNATAGTLISSQNWAQAISSLYAYEGASTQVTELSDWLRTFSSNSTTETPSNTSDATLANTTTGTYDATKTLATLLQVRNTTQNSSSLYDWGAFGLLSPLWSSRNGSTFASARVAPLGEHQRHDNGNANDGLIYDQITLRGRSGLSMQTAFTESIGGASMCANDAVAAAQFGKAFRMPPITFFTGGTA